jgi:aspartate/methionine/tyrosine aminotransferase
MIEERTQARSDYIHWAKTRAGARFNLATSGIAGLPFTELPFKLEEFELSPPGSYGYEELQQRLAKKCGVSSSCVVAATGTSMANYLAMAAVLEAGDEVLIEHPAYEPLLAVARYLGAEIRRFPRSFGNRFQVDPDDVKRATTKKTRLIVLTNLHNPSGARISEETLQEIGEIARDAGARVLVDEVYLEMLFDSRARSAFHLGEHFLATSSLTKAYGLSGLRCGWILASPELAERMWRLNDLFGVIPAHVAEHLSVMALDHLERIAKRAKTILEENRSIFDRFLDCRPQIQAVRPLAGTIVFPRLAHGDGQAFCHFLREKYEVSVVPGQFFEMPLHFRIGIGGDTENLRRGMERLVEALDDFNP